MTFWILCALILFMMQSLLPSLFRFIVRADPQPLAVFGPRDTPPEPTRLAGRAGRALQNMTEAMVLFLPLALLSAVAGPTPQALVGAQIFLLGRAVYVPLYLAGVPFLRSLAYLVGLVGIAMIALSLLATPVVPAA